MSAEDRRAQIIESARDVFAEKGFAAARTREIAAQAGINEAMLYRHFPSKEELFEASVLEAIDAAINRALANADGISNDLTGSPAQIEDGVRRFFADLSFLAIELGPLIGTTMFGPDSAVRELLCQRLEAYFTIARDITAGGMPEWINEGVDIRMGLEFVFGALWFTGALGQIGGRRVDVQEMIDQVTALVYSGFLRPPLDPSHAR